MEGRGEGETRRRRDDESENMKKLLKKMKNKKVAEGRIIGLAGPCLLWPPKNMRPPCKAL